MQTAQVRAALQFSSSTFLFAEKDHRAVLITGLASEILANVAKSLDAAGAPSWRTRYEAEPQSWSQPPEGWP